MSLTPEVNRLIKAAMRRERKSFQQTVNGAIRRGLALERGSRARAPFRVVVHRARRLPGVDCRVFNRLADTLEDEAMLAVI